MSPRAPPLTMLYQRLEALIDDVRREGALRFEDWGPNIERAACARSALNLAHYLALRHRDLRSLQRGLMLLGLSSLGRLESRVMPTLIAVKSALAALLGRPPEARPSARAFFAGERRLLANTHEVLGGTEASPPIALLVTCPTEAASDPDFMLALAGRGVQAVRINCAHDGPDDWARMIDHLRAAEAASGRRMKVFMDLAGPKIRTGEVTVPHKAKRVERGDLVAITRPGGLGSVAVDERHFGVECTLPEAVDASKVGDRIFIDDGKLGAEGVRVAPWGLLARATSAPDRGVRLKPEKGLNFPDRHLDIDALTAKDRTDLEFVAANADGIGFSFVQSAADVAMLQDALAGLRPHDWRTITLILKIETARAVSNLPDMIVQAAGRQPTAIMIARGDLAVEIGFARTAEMQEEILWLGEASDVPVVWATQVLEQMVKTGAPSRGEMTDAAMAARAECVMLNKGPYLLEAIDQLQTILPRMHANQHKKVSSLRKLRSW